MSGHSWNWNWYVAERMCLVMVIHAFFLVLLNKFAVFPAFVSFTLLAQVCSHTDLRWRIWYPLSCAVQMCGHPSLAASPFRYKSALTRLSIVYILAVIGTIFYLGQGSAGDSHVTTLMIFFLRNWSLLIGMSEFLELCNRMQKKHLPKLYCVFYCNTIFGFGFSFGFSQFRRLYYESRLHFMAYFSHLIIGI